MRDMHFEVLVTLQPVLSKAFALELSCRWGPGAAPQQRRPAEESPSYQAEDTAVEASPTTSCTAGGLAIFSHAPTLQAVQHRAAVRQGADPHRPPFTLHPALQTLEGLACLDIEPLSLLLPRALPSPLLHSALWQQQPFIPATCTTHHIAEIGIVLQMPSWLALTAACGLWQDWDQGGQHPGLMPRPDVLRLRR